MAVNILSVKFCFDLHHFKHLESLKAPFHKKVGANINKTETRNTI